MSMTPLLANSLGQSPLASWLVSTPGATGLDDAFAVGPVAWAAIFFLFLVHIVRSKWMTVLVSVLYVAIQVMMMLNLVYGALDPILVRPPVETGLHVFWLVFGVLLIGVGSVYARDWQALRKNPQAKLWIGFPGGDEREDKSSDLFIVRLFVRLFFMLFAVLLGVLSVVSCSVVLADYDVFIMMLRATQEETAQVALRKVLAYVGAFLTPSYAAAVLAVLFCLWDGFRRSVRDRMVIIKLTLAIVFTVLGAGAIITVM